MNLSILFVFICIITLIVYTKHSGKSIKNQPTFVFAQKGSGGKGGGAGPKRGGGGRGGGKGGGAGPKRGGGGRGPKRGGGPSKGGGGPPKGDDQDAPGGDCGLPVKNIDELNTIFNVIGFKFKSGGNIGQAPPRQISNQLPGTPPMPGSNNSNIDEILKQMIPNDKRQL